MRKKESPPPLSSRWHGVEDWAPDVRFYEISIVFIEPFAWAAVMVHYFKSLAYLKIIIERSFVLVLKGGKDLRVVPINDCITMFFMGGYARVAPVLQLNRSLMFASSRNNFPFGLADVFFVRTRTFKTVDPILLVFGGAPFVFSTKNVL